ncbi:cytochrome P450 [Thozetella sp. PMI_491]|nr:cytochrome P450 [Thozetella sp. PMI_491]
MARFQASPEEGQKLLPSWLVSPGLVPVAILASRRFRQEHGCEPIHARLPIRDPIFSSDFVLSALAAFKENRALELSLSRYKTLGHTFALSRKDKTIFTIDPENIKTVLAVNFKDYSHGERPAFMGPLLGRGIFVTDGEEWMHSRTMLRPNFAKEQVADLDIVGRHTSQLLAAIPRRETVDLQPLFHLFTLDSATEFLLGSSTNTLHGDAEGLAFGVAFDASTKDIAYQFRLGPFFRRFQWSRKTVEQNYEACRQYVGRFVRQAMALRSASLDEKRIPNFEDDARNHFLKELANSNESEEQIRDEVLNILLAGRDTTASLLSSFFFLVARRPDIWKKLRAEVSELEGRAPTYEKLRDMKYAKYCLNETLRLYPPVPGNGKVAIRDTVLPRGGGPNGDKPVHVPKGGSVNYSVYSMHRRQDFFGPDAEEFRPERWETLRPSWEYLPFNGGPRICLGQQYALTEALFVVARFAQEFSSIESRDPRPWTENLGVTVCLNNGTLVSLTSDD